MKLILWSCEVVYQIMRLFTTSSEIGWKVKLIWFCICWTWFMIPINLAEPIPKLVCSSMKLSLHFGVFILPPKEGFDHLAIFFCEFSNSMFKHTTAHLAPACNVNTVDRFLIYLRERCLCYIFECHLINCDRSLNLISRNTRDAHKYERSTSSLMCS